MSSSAKSRVLLVSSSEQFHTYLESHLGDRFELLRAMDRKEGLATARKERPDAIVLGYLEPKGTSFKVHNTLREGWITKRIPLLVVDLKLADAELPQWSPEEAMHMDAEDYFVFDSADEVGTEKLSSALSVLDHLHGRISARENSFRETALNPDIFCRTWEQIPGRGAFEMQQEKMFTNVADAAAGGKVHAISVTDNPGGNPALSTEMLCAEVRRGGMEPLVHLACRDKNRNELESMLYGLAAADVRNVLILTGDFTADTAIGGRPKPVFDVDPVQVLKLIGSMNSGLEHVVMGKKTVLAPTDIYAGACVSPFKILESELVPQYSKLKKKIEAGAQFIITQVGFDARKFHELVLWMKFQGYDIPLFANIYLLSHGAGRLMNSGGVPGCSVTDELLADLKTESKAEDNGKDARISRAAKMYAIAKGMGYAGAHIGGHNITYSTVERIIDEGEELAPNWRDIVAEFNYPEKNGFYLFSKDEETGLNTETASPRPWKRRVPFMYRFSRLAHVVLFNPKSIVFKMLVPFARFVDKRRKLTKFFYFFEHIAKVILFECQGCGDCGLFDVAFLCPMSQCPKQQRNGPCGGSREGWCEVYPDERECVWVRAYSRLKRFDEEKSIEEYEVPPCNWELMDTSSWLNFYLGRDHSAKRLSVKQQ